MYTKFWSANLMGRNKLEDLGEGSVIILDLIFRDVRCEGVDWMHLAQYRDSGKLLWTR
jgi:hypothetical protein